VYTAGFASRPQDIDPILEKIRRLTAMHQGDAAQLTADEKTQLKDIYIALEEYLMTKESLRKLDRRELRSRLPEGFRKSLQSVER
jgi:hypothetical protein